MNLSHPLVDLVGENTARIITRLGMVDVGLSGRRIAELSGVPVASASRALAKLESLGLVHSEDVGPSRLYRLNREHVLWTPLDLTSGIPEIINQTIADLAAGSEYTNTTVAVFGSFAEGGAGSESDIDVAIVNEVRASEESRFSLVSALHERIRAMTGNSLDIVDIDDDDLTRMVASHDPLLDSWVANSRTLSGPGLVDRIRQARER